VDYGAIVTDMCWDFNVSVDREKDLARIGLEYAMDVL